MIIAEAGVGHEGDVGNAFRLVEAAKEGGADAVKFQMYRAVELVDRDRDRLLYERFKRKELGYSTFRELKSYAESLGLIWFATPHTESALEYLEGLGVEYYKVGSGEKGSGLIDKIVGKGKQTFISTGLRNEAEVGELMAKYDLPNVMFLHCKTCYPVKDEEADLGFIKRGMGYSSHCVGYMDCVVASVLGASVIEKHIKIKESTGQDTHGALFASDFRKMVNEIELVRKMIGDGKRHYYESERVNEAWALKGEDGRRPR